MADESPSAALRKRVEQSTIAIPGAFNALTARLIEQAGFECMYLSGAAFSAGALSLPDVGLTTLSELAEETRRLTRAAAIPLLVDADTGFGDAIHVERTVRELEAAGADAIQLEDQCLPKRCGHLSGKTLIGANEMSAKLRAAVAAKSDPSLIIVARTDARGVDGFDAAVERTKAYLDAGADWIFPEALKDRDEFALFARKVRAPLVANMTEFGQSPLLSVDELSELGYAAVLFPVTLLRVAMKGVDAALGLLQADGTQRELLDVMMTRQELYDLLQYTDYEKRDRSFFQGEPT